MTTTQTFTFDLQNGVVLTLDDLFLDTAAALEVISPIVQADITTRLGEMLDTQWLEDGSGTSPDNYQAFALDGDHLIFYFQPYQVAAYAAGTQVVSIPLSDLSSVLKPEFAS
jgi:hypothetical protein